MLGFPSLLFPVSSVAPRECDFINDTRAVFTARIQGLDNFTMFAIVEGFLYAARAVIKLQLGFLGTGVALLMCLNCVFVITQVYAIQLEDHCEMLWEGIFNQWGFSKEFRAHPLLQDEWEGKPPCALPGIHWPESALKYRDGKYNPCVLIADQIHRHLSILWFGVAGVASFALLPPVIASLYSAYMGALFLFQQEGLRIYPKSPRLYHLLDITFKGGALCAAVFHPELLWFSSRFTQVLFVAYVACDSIYSIPKMLFGEGCSLKFGRKSGTSRPFLDRITNIVLNIGAFYKGFEQPASLTDVAAR